MICSEVFIQRGPVWQMNRKDWMLFLIIWRTQIRLAIKMKKLPVRHLTRCLELRFETAHRHITMSVSLGVKIGETYTDYSQGSVRQTGGTYDLALSGSGFFAVSVTDKAGEVHTRYTRDGRFHLTKDGLLVDADGNAVQGQNGNITIDPSSKNVSISATGQITADGELVDTLNIVDFEDYDYLKKYGDTMYEPVDGATTKDAEGEILQGYTEQSNVNVVREMVDMITITRAYEAGQKVIRSYDSMLDKSVNQVGALK